MEATQGYDVIAGYRMIRKLGAGDRSEVFLGHALERQVPPVNSASGVAVKIFHAHVAADSIDREIRARTTVGGDGLAALLDLATMPDGRACIVLERLDGRSLPAMLAHRGRIAPGEAVTILAPLITTVAGLHRAGLVITTLTQSAVQLTATGRPILTSLGGLREGAESHNDLVHDDYRRLTVLMRSVFDHLARDDARSRRAEALASWFEMAETRLPFLPCLDELERRLFEWSPATPVELDQGPAVTGQAAVPARISAWNETNVTSDALSNQVDDGTRPIGDPVLRLADARPLTAARAFLRSVLGRRRRSIVVAGCVGAALVVLVLTLVPPAGDGTGTDGPQSVPAASAPADSADTAVAPETSRAGQDAQAVTGDEPVAAAAALLRMRAECLSGASIVCLDTVDQAGSAALAADRYRLDRSAAAAESSGGSQSPTVDDPADYGVSLVERTGDSALIALEPGSASEGKEEHSEPASLLVVKGEAGWRIREIFGF